jgi:predicted alpha-1,2-mannosidase
MADSADSQTNNDAEEDAVSVPLPTLNTDDEALDAVNAFIGSGGAGFAFGGMTPAAQRPLSWVRLGPDTTDGGSHAEVQHFGGFYFDDPDIRGFSHTHFVGTGVADYGNIRLLPLTGFDGPRPDLRFSPFDRGSQSASPGRYDVRLTQPDVAVSLTTGEWTGAHRYVFAQAGDAFLSVDVASSVDDQGVQDAEVSVIDGPDGQEVVGWVRYRGGYVGRGNPYTLHFSMVTSAPIAEARVWDVDGLRGAGQAQQAQGVEAGVVLRFDVSSGQAVEARVGLSLIDLDAARAHRAAEAPLSAPFDAIAASSRAAWADKLGRARIGGGSPDERALFFTSLYNLYRMPSRLDELDGRYVGVDAQVHTWTGGGHYYTDLSLWDSFRTTHPWYALVDHPVATDCLRSLMAMYEAGGVLPRWPAALSFTGGMIGSSADFLFAEAFLKGVGGLDYDAAFDALMVTAMGDPPLGAGHGGRGDMAAYLQYGYLPSDLADESVSRTLEFVYADAALARMASGLGRDEAPALTARGEQWRALLHPDSGFFQPKRSDGTWAPDFDPLRVDMRSGYFTEGNAWHWRFYTPHDLGGLRAALGAEAFGAALERFFKNSTLGRRSDPWITNILPDLFYWHGNEPPLHAVYGFAYAGDSERLGFWLRQIQGRLYATTPAGLAGNDDGGTLSGWYVFSALGFYPIAGTDQFIIGAPLFSHAMLTRHDGQTLVIEAEGASATRSHVQAARLDDSPVQGPTLTDAQLWRAQRLRFQLAP